MWIYRTVSKEAMSDSRQELKVEKLVYALDDGDEECNPLLNRPGKS